MRTGMSFVSWPRYIEQSGRNILEKLGHPHAEHKLVCHVSSYCSLVVGPIDSKGISAWQSVLGGELYPLNFLRAAVGM
jgi:hypothetical protein